MDELRRQIGAAGDTAVRARLRTDLAGLLRAAGEMPGALAELRRAADEAPGLGVVRLAVLSAARALPALDRAAFLVEIGHIARSEIPVWAAAAAEAQREAGRPVQAARAWLALAGDNRFPAHQRRAAARHAIKIASAGLPAEHLSALRLRAAETSGRARLGFLREALVLAAGAGIDPSAGLATAAAWVEAGGAPARIESLLEAAEKAGGPIIEEVARLRREIDRRWRAGSERGAGAGAAATGGARAGTAKAARAPARGSRPGAAAIGTASGKAAAPTPPPVGSVPGKTALTAAREAADRGPGAEPRDSARNGELAVAGGAAPASSAARAAERAERADPWDRALAAARAGRGVLARRLAERALRSANGAAAPSRLAAVEAALRGGGLDKQALLLRRTLLEAQAPGERAAALEALIAEADTAGHARLAETWRRDLGIAAPAVVVPVPAQAASKDRAPATPVELYRQVQRQLIRLPEDGDTRPVLALLARAVAGHVGADAALALGERLLRRSGEVPGKPFETRMIDLLRAAFDHEDRPSRRARLADRLAGALELDGDPSGALAILDRAITAGTLEVLAPLRRRRAALLRQLGRSRELIAVLAADAQALTGRERLAVLAERAQLLDAGGEPERALAERLVALGEMGSAAATPPLGPDGRPMPILAPARRRLESTGRFDQSLRLAAAAVHHVTEREERLKLLRDIASLSQKAARDPSEVAMAWLAVLELDRDDVSAAESAERVLMATGEWQRCADLLSWAAARAQSQKGDGGAARGALLWRLAELRRSRLGQQDEALRLYRELGAPASPRAARSPGTRGKLQNQLVLHSARIAVAPGQAEKAQAFVDRGLVLLTEAGRTAEAEADFSAALDLDPRNVDVMTAFERLCERTQRWDELGRRLEQKAATLPAASASRLWYGVGRVAERLEDLPTARAAYERSASLDASLVEPVIALRRLATRRADWSEVARLLDLELALGAPGANDPVRLVELASIVGDKLGNGLRALALLEKARAVESADPGTLDLLFRFALAAPEAAQRKWELAAQALERLLAAGAEVIDIADRYFRIATDAEAAGRLDEALVYFSRSYARNTNHRPTLERLSFICFEKGQWDNAWRATEALLDRHRATLSPAELAELFVRSALCDVHIAQRLAATAQLATMVTSSGGGVRDLAETWSAMRIEPRLLTGLEGDRRTRVLERVGTALAAEGCSASARKHSWEIRGALAIVERRWADARAALEVLAGDGAVPPAERCGYLIAAGDITLKVERDPEAANRFYARARTFSAGDPRLQSRGDHAEDGAFTEEIAKENTGDIVR
jgi:tetratricopeptide (TPR) repeat protein